MRAAVFPGQGTQHPGMGERFRNLFAGARDVFALASDVLGRDMEVLCFRSSPEVLRDTRNAQVAVVVTGLAALEVARDVGFEPDLVAGHSVGELTALIAAGAASVEAGLRATATRAELMGALPRGGSMCAVLGLTSAELDELCGSVSTSQAPVVVAVHNAPKSVVVSGEAGAVGSVMAAAKSLGAKCRQLDVSHAFHSPLMTPVAAQWRDYLAELDLHDPVVPIVGNVSAQALTTASDVRAELADQLTSAVLWRQSVENMRDSGVTLALEVGDSRTLAALARNAEPALRTLSLAEPRTLRALSAE